MFDFKFDWCKEMECGVPAIDDQIGRASCRERV